MGRAPCCDKNGLKKGPWTPEEDEKLIDYIKKHGYGNWRTLPKNAGLQRCGKSCRLRWTNYLRPDIKRGRFSFEEEETIIQLHSILGNKWSAIAARLPGRTDNEIKNYWNTHIRKRLLRMGIDPVTHSPRLDLLDLSSILNPSLYINQMNLSRLMGVQPEVLKLATSLLSSNRQNSNLLIPNVDNNFHQLIHMNPQVQTQQLASNIHDIPFSSEAQLMHATPPTNMEHLENHNEWQSNGIQAQDYGYFHDNFQSVFPTPSSSPTPLNSNSTYFNNSSATTTEDEKDSYCSNILNFDIPTIWDANDFSM